MNEVRCAHCNADAMEFYWRLDESMAVHCKSCDKSFPASRLKGCPQCGSHELRMVLDGDCTIKRCDACGRTLGIGALGNCPSCDSDELEFITRVGDVIVECKQCGRSGTPEEMTKVVETAPLEASGASGCFIATAAYGSALAPEVLDLRSFRDNVLRPTRLGRAAIALYEAVSPPLAFVIRRSEALRRLARTLVVRPARGLALRLTASRAAATDAADPPTSPPSGPGRPPGSSG